jgi:hypothetical protein
VKPSTGLQYLAAVLAAAAFFFADVFGWTLSSMTVFALGGLAGLNVPRPSEMAGAVMRSLKGGAAGLLVLLLGCAHAEPSVAIDGARTALKGVDIAADTAIDTVIAGRDARVTRCRDELGAGYSEAEARQCMGALANDLAPIAEQARDAYQLALEALDALEHAIRQVTPLIEEAREELNR